MLLYTRRAAPKTPRKRSRAGCIYCKEKKKKCDEKRPQCDRCSERDQQCIYEPIKPRVRRKRDSFTGSTVSDASAVSALATSAPDGGVLLDPRMDEGGGLPADEDSDGSTKFERDGTRFDPNWHPAGPASLSARSLPLAFPECQADFPAPESCDWEVSPDESEYSPYATAPARIPAGRTQSDQRATSLPYLLSAISPAVAPVTPSVPPFASPGQTVSAPPFASADTGPGGRDAAPPVGRAGASVAYFSNAADPPARPRPSSAANPSSPSPSSALVPSRQRAASHPSFSPRISAFVLRQYSEFSDRPSRRALVDHFNNVMSHLIVLGEETANPFQKLVLPLCRSSPVVLNAVYSLSGAHLEHRGIALGGKDSSAEFHHHAVLGLRRLLNEADKVDRNEMLAAIMLLVYYEVLVQKTRSCFVDRHLMGAVAIINNKKVPLDTTGSFLERAFHFYDVITALSFGTAPLSRLPSNETLAPFTPPDIASSSLLRNVDTLLGLATTLWPVIHRLAGLRPLKAELRRATAAGQVQQAAHIAARLDVACAAVGAALTGWEPILPANFYLDEGTGAPPAVAAGDDPSAGHAPPISAGARLRSIVRTALAYRHGALVYLQRTIRERPRGDRLVQKHAHAALEHCEGTAAGGGPMGALLWPLFVASCEVTGEAGRRAAARTFVAVEKRQGMTNIWRAWTIVQEVWMRVDAAGTASTEDDGREGSREVAAAERRRNIRKGKERAGDDDGCGGRHGEDAEGLEEMDGGEIWRRVCREMGFPIVFG